jgi:hypothetical protein
MATAVPCWAGHHLEAAVEQHRAVVKLRDEDILCEVLRESATRCPHLAHDPGLPDRLVGDDDGSDLRKAGDLPLSTHWPANRLNAGHSSQFWMRKAHKGHLAQLLRALRACGHNVISSALYKPRTHPCSHVPPARFHLEASSQRDTQG